VERRNHHFMQVIVLGATPHVEALHSGSIGKLVDILELDDGCAVLLYAVPFP
jgi:hypothetical protein